MGTDRKTRTSADCFVSERTWQLLYTSFRKGTGSEMGKYYDHSLSEVLERRKGNEFQSLCYTRDAEGNATDVDTLFHMELA
jgi:hypothetical protein